ncbi:peptide ABC transporter substrate-binding protein [Bacillus sp. RG28]|uniref:Peptide ABC transporter substrate-binding protein n=1 Tax=Gottfriedia endophytica TaxID=2820819 RepID=A0A940SIL0_9BACI|nr:peptide ABC transporter substrate-binding protein [Gottfriedia endophytica]MBP0725090.1 peptide ABC transporter substrate-binding protein [Gottfriedia endophytica]
MKHKMIKSIGLITSLSFLLAACSGNQSTSTSNDKTIKLMDTADITSLDSSIALDGPSLNALNSVMEGLYMPNEKGEYTPAAALSHTVSKDGKTYTFKLRTSHFSNGDPVTANDFVFAFKRALDPATKAQFAYDMYDIKNAEAINKGKLPVDQLGVKAIDQSTLQIELNRPIPYFIQLTSLPMFFPLDEKFVKKEGDKYGQEANTTVYNGPFVVSKWNHGVGFVMKKNNQYYDKQNVKADTIDVKVMNETSTAVNLYETGALDQAIIDSDVIDRFKSSKELHTLAMPIISYISFNEMNPLLRNKKARVAIAHAFDKNSIANDLLKDGSIPTDRFVPKGLVKTKKGEDFVNSTTVDSNVSLSQAKQLFSEALKEEGKTSATLSLLVSDSETSRKIGEYLKAQLEGNLPHLTINIVVQPIQQKNVLRRQGGYDLSLDTWGADYPDPTTYLDLFTSNSALNFIHYKNEQYDRLVEEANTVDLQNESKRFSVLHQAENTLLNDGAVAPIYQAGYVYLQKPNVNGIKVRPFVGYFYYKYASKTTN